MLYIIKMVNVEKILKKMNITQIRKVYCKVKNISKTSLKKIKLFLNY